MGGGGKIFYCVNCAQKTSIWGPQVTKQQGNSYHKRVCRSFVVNMGVLVEVFLIIIVYFHTGK